MIVRELVNLTGLAVLRPDRSGPGGDPVGDPAVVLSGLDAIYEPERRVVKSGDGSQVTITGTFWIDPVDSSGSAVDVRENDWLQYVNFRGETVVEKRIVRLAPWWCGAEMDHIEIAVGE